MDSASPFANGQHPFRHSVNRLDPVNVSKQAEARENEKNRFRVQVAG
jgi:hypothetical protein